ncbi:MAG TPA: tyrosine-protein phosphatase [Ramlibacter sp.]|uniref:protein-tyrosine phosphatase family protein n=1 Tax=Ramlibacter sp. TaxID=1917967 RepID=UPI002CE95A44|nr:tyrosine-protein phosphatase [Ramlibacter sp.]HVZ43370.1 tyrosine-protein phosphatase [Ramlibacter sp.]
MSLRPVTLPPEIPGRLWLASMPGRFESWASFEMQAHRTRLGLVVCLTPRSELADLSPEYHAAVVAGDVPFRWLNLPVPNFGVPDDRAGFREDVLTIAQALRRGDAVMLHCAAGMGRTGSTAACVLKVLGLTTDAALQRVREAGSNPQNALQSGLVDWF